MHLGLSPAWPLHRRHHPAFFPRPRTAVAVARSREGALCPGLVPSPLEWHCQTGLHTTSAANSNSNSNNRKVQIHFKIVAPMQRSPDPASVASVHWCTSSAEGKLRLWIGLGRVGCCATLVHPTGADWTPSFRCLLDFQAQVQGTAPWTATLLLPSSCVQRKATLMRLSRDRAGVAMCHQAHCLLVSVCDSGSTWALLQPFPTTSPGGVISFVPDVRWISGHWAATLLSRAHRCHFTHATS